MAEPEYRTILNTLVTALRDTTHYRHVGIDEQRGPNALQCPAVFVSLGQVTWTPERLTGGIAASVAPFRIAIGLTCTLWIFSAQGPHDVVAQRLDALRTLVTDLRDTNTLNGLVLYTLPQHVYLPDPAQDDSGAIFGQATLTGEAHVLG